MMVVDTSALVSILKVEQDASTLLRRLGNSGANRIATATLLEAQMVVISQLNEAGLAELELLMNRAQIQVMPFNADHMRWALHGWRRYGKGRHQPPLKLGDCSSYGLAKAMDAPLLFKGEDFQYTDVKVAA